MILSRDCHDACFRSSGLDTLSIRSEPRTLSLTKAELASRAVWQNCNLDLENRLSTIRQWLNDCTPSHTTCNLDMEELPGRLIDVGPDFGFQAVKLIDTSAILTTSPS